MSEGSSRATKGPGRRRPASSPTGTAMSTGTGGAGGATKGLTPRPPLANGATTRAAGTAGTRASARAATGHKHEDHGPDKTTRERILDAAMDLFIDQGYDKTSLREIAARMGFTKAALYYHFPSKADMLMAVHLKMHGLIEEPLAILGDGPTSSEQWERFLDACIEQMQANIKLFLVHRVNQAAFANLHLEGHEGSHQELEEKARKIFSDPSLGPELRVRMAAAFAVAFVTPIMVGTWLDLATNATDVSATLKEAVRSVLDSAGGGLGERNGALRHPKKPRPGPGTN